jgi:hypothetical protein
MDEVIVIKCLQINGFYEYDNYIDISNNSIALIRYFLNLRTIKLRKNGQNILINKLKILD